MVPTRFISRSWLIASILVPFALLALLLFFSEGRVQVPFLAALFASVFAGFVCLERAMGPQAAIPAIVYVPLMSWMLMLFSVVLSCGAGWGPNVGCI